MPAAAIAMPEVRRRAAPTLGTHNPDGLLSITGVTAATTPTPAGFGLVLRRFGSLFPHPPSVSDVKQWGLGDCFLLSSAMAVLSHPGGSQIIEEMMKDDNRGHVYVRLYDPSLAPRILRMKKGIRVSFQHAYGSLWVQMLEAAYGAMYSKGSYAVLQDGGQSQSALTAILGAQAGPLTTEAASTAGDQELISRLMNICNCENPKVFALVKKELFENDDVLFSGWKAYFRTSAHKRWIEHLSKQVKVQDWKMEQLLSFLEKEQKTGSLSMELKTYVSDWLTSRNVLPGKRGSGIYTQAQLNFYTALDDALRRNLPATASTMETVGTSTDGRGGAGEQKSKGLAGKHVYALLECQIIEDVRFILVRNPWGEGNPFGSAYGRGYVTKTKPDGTQVLSPRAIRAAEFWMELADFDKRFYKLIVGGNPISERRERSIATV